MKITYKILFTLILTAFTFKINALTYGGCSYTTVAKLKALVNNINLSYTYEIKDNNACFNITLNNIPKGVAFKDLNTQKTYTYSDTKNGEITIYSYKDGEDGQYRFTINNNVCDGIKLGTKYYKLPIYNTRYQSESCKDIPNYFLCKKWLSKYYSDYEFEKNINEYKESFNATDDELDIKYEKDLISKIVGFYIKYYYYFLPAIILICIIVMHVSKKKNSFKL